MNCTEVHGKITSWIFRKLDDELSASENREFEAHLAECSSCSREYRLASLPRRIAQSLPDVAPSPFFRRKLAMSIEAETRNAAGWQAVWGIARQMIPALAGLTLALLSVFAYLEINAPKPELSATYERVFKTEYQPQRALVFGQGDITDENVLAAIAERGPAPVAPTNVDSK